MINDLTARYSLPLPHAANRLDEDVARLRSSISGLDGLLYTHARDQSLNLDYQSHWADNLAMTYDGSGRVTTLTETFGAATQVTTFTYNASEQVTQAVIVGNGVTRTETFTYDGGGQLTAMTATEVPF